MIIKGVKNNDTNAKTVYPDIIIHNRGTNSNYVVIEAKKYYVSETRKREDMQKLKEYKKQLNYKYAVFVVFYIENNIDKYNFNEWLNYINNNIHFI